MIDDHGLMNDVEARFKHFVFNHLTFCDYFSRRQLIKVTFRDGL